MKPFEIKYPGALPCRQRSGDSPQKLLGGLLLYVQEILGPGSLALVDISLAEFATRRPPIFTQVNLGSTGILALHPGDVTVATTMATTVPGDRANGRGLVDLVTVIDSPLLPLNRIASAVDLYLADVKYLVASVRYTRPGVVPQRVDGRCRCMTERVALCLTAVLDGHCSSGLCCPYADHEHGAAISLRVSDKRSADVQVTTGQFAELTRIHDDFARPGQHR